jgi:hypothetical protein
MPHERSRPSHTHLRPPLQLAAGMTPWVLVCLVAALAFTLTACGGGDGGTDNRASSEGFCRPAPVRGAGFDRFGGWKGIAAQATGRFRTAQVDGVWWFITPEGHGLFSNGVTGIDPEGDFTADGNDPYGENVLARYGSVEAWADNTLMRLCDLGVTTLAAWTNSSVHLFTGKRAYPVSVSFQATAPAVAGWPAGLTGVHLRDFFDPAWPDTAHAFAQSDEAIQRCATDAWCYGVFIDNELPWSASTLSVGTHLDAYLSLPPGAPGKRALQSFFEERYGGDVGALNAAWGLHLAGFDDLQQLTSATNCSLTEPLGDDACLARESEVQRADRMAFEAEVAGRYASVVADALHSAAPGVLNLGMRFFSIYTHPDVVGATAPFVDVVSLNDYDYGTRERATLVRLSAGTAFGYLFGHDAFSDLTTLHDLSGKPVLIGEWFYRVQRTDGAGIPLPPLFPEVASHEQQAEAYRAYAQQVIALPFVVGHHWFQWMDQPRQGRRDGENQWIGVVDIEDNLRLPLANAMRDVNSTLVTERAALAGRVASGSVPPADAAGTRGSVPSP